MQKALPSAMPHVVNKDFNDLKDSKVNFAVRQTNFQCVSSALPLRFMQGEYGEAGRGIGRAKHDLALD